RLVSKVCAQPNQISLVACHVNQFELLETCRDGGKYFVLLRPRLNGDAKKVSIFEAEAQHRMTKGNRGPKTHEEVEPPELVQIIRSIVVMQIKVGCSSVLAVPDVVNCRPTSLHFRPRQHGYVLSPLAGV